MLADLLKEQLSSELPGYEIHLSKEDGHPLVIV